MNSWKIHIPQRDVFKKLLSIYDDNLCQTSKHLRWYKSQKRQPKVSKIKKNIFKAFIESIGQIIYSDMIRSNKNLPGPRLSKSFSADGEWFSKIFMPFSNSSKIAAEAQLRSEMLNCSMQSFTAILKVG